MLPVENISLLLCHCFLLVSSHKLLQIHFVLVFSSASLEAEPIFFVQEMLRKLLDVRGVKAKLLMTSLRCLMSTIDDLLASHG